MPRKFLGSALLQRAAGLAWFLRLSGGVATSSHHVSSSMQRLLEADAGKLASACHERASSPATHRSRKLAHAIRNGLNGAKLHLELVRQDLLELGAAQHTLDALRTVERQLDHTAQLLNQPAEAAASHSAAGDETRD